MFQEQSGLPNQVELEKEMLQLWEERYIFDKLRGQNRNGKRFAFLDGPITANNPMGVHHAWGRTLKDLYQRYWAMHGRELRYQNGFDGQGLWVEVEVERQLGFKSKREIENFGIARFVEQCKERVAHFSKVITDESVRLGYWMEWENSYDTTSPENNYAIWRFLKKCHERGLVYLGKDVMPWCPRCGTGLSQQELSEGYKEVVHPAMVVKFPLVGREKEFLLVWTTTPWTLTANVAAAVNPNQTYAKLRQGEEVYYLAEARVGEVMEFDEPWQVEDKLAGSELLGLSYESPFSDLPLQQEALGGVREPRPQRTSESRVGQDLVSCSWDGAGGKLLPNDSNSSTHRVIPWEEVSEAEGTGIVHIAPGCGKEDFELGKAHGLPVVEPIAEDGTFYSGAGPFAGMNASRVAGLVQEVLQEKGLLYRVDDYRHSYPHCWRCGAELLFRLVDEWFIAMDSWRQEIMALVDQIEWVPSYGRELELDWLRNMHDWMISKKRYWGLALPIWRCKCGWFDVIGSKEELEARAVEGWEEFEGNTPHRPWVDAVKIKCEQCCQLANRIPDVGNPWLDAGIVPYSTMGYFDDRQYWEEWFPAELIIESLPGQFRNWFYALLAMSAMLEGRAPFKTLVGHQSVLDVRGEEMHKSKGNAIWFSEAAEQIGADMVRWLCVSQPLTQPLHFGLERAEEVRAWLRTLWNVYSFLATYANVDGWPWQKVCSKIGTGTNFEHELAGASLDRWLEARLAVATEEVSSGVEAYNPARATSALLALLDDLSNWWVRRSRRRFWKSGSGEDKMAAYATLHQALLTFSRLLAPFMPFSAEALYQRLVMPFGDKYPESVHLCKWPESVATTEGKALLTEADLAREVIRLGRAAREKAGLRVRQPLATAFVILPGKSALPHFEQDVLEELNVRQIKFMTDAAELGPAYLEGNGLAVGLDTNLTEELLREGIVRDLVRHIQTLRKQAGLRVQDHIRLWIDAQGSTEVEKALAQYRDYIAAETLAAELAAGPVPGEVTVSQVRLAGQRVGLALRRAHQEPPHQSSREQIEHEK